MSYESKLEQQSMETILLGKRIINLVGEVDDAMAYRVTSALQIMDSEDSTKEIQLLINSPGGSCISGLAIIDTMQFISAPVVTVCTGLAASMGAAILVHGDKRYALPNSRILFHQASGGTGRQNIQDARISFKEFEEVNDRLAEMISERVGMSKEDYLSRTQRDFCEWSSEFLPGKFGTKGAIDEVFISEKKKLRG